MALCTDAIALAPSPVAAATRFIEPERTSPTANTAGNVGLERKRLPPQVGPGRSEVIVGQLDVGSDEAVIFGGYSGQPAGGGLGPDEAEQARARLGLGSVRRPVGDADFLEKVGAIQPGDLAPAQHRHPRMDQQPVDEIGRHPGGDVRAADHQRDLTTSPGQIQRGLTGRVRAADHRNRAARTPPGLQFGGRVVDTGALKIRPALQRQRPVAGASRDDDGPAVYEFPARQVERGAGRCCGRCRA